MPTGNDGWCAGLRSRAADLAGLEMANLRGGVGGLFRASPRYGRLQATAAGASRATDKIDALYLWIDSVGVGVTNTRLWYWGAGGWFWERG